MATVNTLRPTAILSSAGWTPTGGTLTAVTSDDSDATYATWSGVGGALILSVGPHSPPANHARHLVRGRVRGEDGSVVFFVQTATGSLISGSSAELPASPATFPGSYGAGPGFTTTGTTTLAINVTGQTANLRVQELYVDIDNREAPTFTPQVLDGDGSPDTTITDTNSPQVRPDHATLDLDDLPLRQYRYWVTQGAVIIWDTSVTSSASAPTLTVPPLENGSYTLHMQLWSTIQLNTAYASDEETLAFTVTTVDVPAPDAVAISQVPDTPFFEISVELPADLSDFDEPPFLEVHRIDCDGETTVLRDGPVQLPGLLMDGSDGGNASTPDHASLDITGDIDLRADVTLDDWTPATNQGLIGKFLTTGDQRSYLMRISTTGNIVIFWSPDGTSTNQLSATSSIPVPAANGERMAVRATLDVNNGAGQRVITFYTSPTLSGSWTQLGTNAPVAGTTSIHSGSATLFAGAWNTGATEEMSGTLHGIEVRDGINGTAVANPDFSAQDEGTVTFTDAAGREWTVNGTARITGTTFSIIDWSAPRSLPEDCVDGSGECPFLYRVRLVGLVDGQMVASDWFGEPQSPIVSGVIVGWPSTVASIPFGWTRETDLDSRYLKGIATAATEPGTVGGASTHVHATPGHAHISLSHSHASGSTGAAVGSQSITNAAGQPNFYSTTSHTHTRPSTSSDGVTSGSTAPGTDTNSNELDRASLIWMRATQPLAGIPNGAVALMPDISPASWDTYADATGRFLKGAAASQDGGGTGASSLTGHIHEVSSHTHAGTVHGHFSANTGTFTSNVPGFGGAQADGFASSHSHPVTIADASSASLIAAAGGTSGSDTPALPPWINVRVRQNSTGGLSIPQGTIAVWDGPLSGIPDGWFLCDGNNGTPNMVDRYPLGATASIGTTGGSVATHTHTGSSHTHSTTGHSHSSTIGQGTHTNANMALIPAQTTVATENHTHSANSTNSTTPTFNSASTGTLDAAGSEPLHRQVAFIQFDELPPTPPAPVERSLFWTNGEHLIRTETPEGPVFTSVCGTLSWEVNRPFTAMIGVNGTRQVYSTPPGGHNFNLDMVVRNEQELAEVLTILDAALVLVSPADSEEQWAAPVSGSVQVVKVGRFRRVQSEMVATGPEPPQDLEA